MAEGGSNWGGSQRWEAGFQRQSTSFEVPLRAAPGVSARATPGLRGSAIALVAVKGVNTQVLSMNAVRGPPRPGGNCGHREFGLKSGFVFRVTPIWQNSDYSTANMSGTWSFLVEVCYVLSRGVLGMSERGFFLSG